MFNLRINIEQKNIVIETEENQNLMDILLKNSLPINCTCGGKKTCGKCRIICKDIKPSKNDKKLLTEKNINDGIRIACDKKIKSNLSLTIIPSVMTQIETRLYKEPMPSLTNAIAIDIGTTTVAVYIIVYGIVSKVYAFENPQRIIGADVITRIKYACDNKNGAARLKKLLINKINSIFPKLEKIYPNLCIDNILVTGNTAMLHLFWGESTAGMAKSPYVPSFLKTKKSNNTIFSNLDKNVTISTAPCIGAFVGGDVACSLLAADCHEWDNNSFFIDIGTNGEMAIGTKNKIYCCATAAGPAFEGAGLSCGCPSISGAINSFFVKNGKIEYETIENAEPIGICGSGIIDALSTMLDIGAIDESGALNMKNENVCAINGTLCFKLSDAVFITQKDIREIQLAKAAIRTGIDILLNKINITANELDKVYLAGSFGSNINIVSAIRIGLFPKEFCGKIENMGNAAGCGAILALCSQKALRDMDLIVQSCIKIDLSGETCFQNFFIDNLLFE